MLLIDRSILLSCQSGRRATSIFSGGGNFVGWPTLFEASIHKFSVSNLAAAATKYSFIQQLSIINRNYNRHFWLRELFYGHDWSTLTETRINCLWRRELQSVAPKEAKLELRIRTSSLPIAIIASYDSILEMWQCQLAYNVRGLAQWRSSVIRQPGFCTRTGNWCWIY